jgi:site-specific DNA-adenine methylase
MAFQGGKGYGKRYILHVLNHPRYDGWEYGEFFFGMGHIGSGVTNKSLYHFSDLSPRLISLHRAVQQGESLPKNISKTEYNRLKEQDGNDFKSAAAAYLYTWQGKEWGGYVDKRDGRQYAKARMRHLDKISKREAYQNAVFECCSILDPASQLEPYDMLIYNDPPYEGTTPYRINKDCPFDHDAYWELMRKWSLKNIIFTSELKAPPDFTSVTSYKTRGRTEHLFIWKHTPFMKIVNTVRANTRLPLK